MSNCSIISSMRSLPYSNSIFNKNKSFYIPVGYIDYFTSSTIVCFIVDPVFININYIFLGDYIYFNNYCLGYISSFSGNSFVISSFVNMDNSCLFDLVYVKNG